MKSGKATDKGGAKSGSVKEDAASGTGTAGTLDSNSPRTRTQSEQVKVWEEEGGSPPEQMSSTKSVKPKTASKTGTMGPAKD